MKRICQSPEPINERTAFRLALESDFPLLKDAIVCAVLSSAKRCEYVGYHCIENQEKPIVYISRITYGLKWYIGFDLITAARILSCAKKRDFSGITFMYANYIIRSFFKHLEYRLKKQKIRYNKQKMKIKTFSATPEFDIELIDILNYYIKKQANGK
jgi:hypothetical protein